MNYTNLALYENTKKKQFPVGIQFALCSFYWL